MKRQLPRVVVTSLVALFAVSGIRSAGPVQAQQVVLENLATSFCLDSNTDRTAKRCGNASRVGRRLQEWRGQHKGAVRIASPVCLLEVSAAIS
jgi:hypothetical protein